ncbi:hypothetical protein [Sediminivirga luteola]|uniref:DUF8094 domain-containing protein n=1 Tax=Sediminivirga luteola TaxID=1774748 RepID=A0A8J2TXH3_9MICO|nr:hypothetical protein [Sediminivirga luteola]MCI2266316.1 hypothetical protein [Sediminivirga luteola]GGA12564.1 hypothetical protein GCM10011333_14310 [Sediminivirga luteola]
MMSQLPQPFRPGRPAGLAGPARLADPRRLSRRRGFAAAVAAAGALALTGCDALQVAQPEAPEVPPPSKVAAQPDQAAEFLAGYSDRLGEALGQDGEGLEDLQAAPLLERTQAELLIAEASDETLASMSYVDIIPAAPMLSEYPLWFIAVATPYNAEESRQIMLVSRENAAGSWRVNQTAFLQADAVPVFLGDGEGAVEPAEPGFTERARQAEEQLAGFLAGGDEPSAAAVDSQAFQDYRDYQGELSDPENGFDDVSAECAPYSSSQEPLLERALSTQDGAIALGEVRCTLQISVGEEFALNLGPAVEAVMTGDGTGNTVQVSTSHPYVVTETDGELTLRATDWYLLEAVTD